MSALLHVTRGGPLTRTVHSAGSQCRCNRRTASWHSPAPDRGATLRLKRRRQRSRSVVASHVGQSLRTSTLFTSTTSKVESTPTAPPVKEATIGSTWGRHRSFVYSRTSGGPLKRPSSGHACAADGGGQRSRLSQLLGKAHVVDELSVGRAPVHVSAHVHPACSKWPPKPFLMQAWENAPQTQLQLCIWCNDAPEAHSKDHENGECNVVIADALVSLCRCTRSGVAGRAQSRLRPCCGGASCQGWKERNRTAVLPLGDILLECAASLEPLLNAHAAHLPRYGGHAMCLANGVMWGACKCVASRWERTSSISKKMRFRRTLMPS